ncbi:hypothetical protein [Fluoribacter dumoffii]|uniref:hypothetical protein n=2 Tax=Fluoribacter dumoffii TaxID=463 RepID=UPI002244AEE4|nr:hypothetical protein [Fluoribacter dumoffii]MCW8418176.1 hypothetical protein [Fluoribacter dumoffii]
MLLSDLFWRVGTVPLSLDYLFIRTAMKAKILLSNEYKNTKENLLNIFQVWEETIKDYKKKYDTEDSTLVHAWEVCFERMKFHLLSNRNQLDCFLIFDNSGELQGCAFGAKRNHGNFSDTLWGNKSISYHIHDLLTAPWNIKGRAFKDSSDNHPLTDKYKKIGTQLVKVIANHASTQGVSQIVAELVSPWDAGDFFEKCSFTQSRVQAGLAYELPKSKFDQVSNLKIDGECYITVFGTTADMRVRENYPQDFEVETEFNFRFLS